ncbi:phytoene desaturase family protein [Actinoalloteichus spitiensis]|uniref:phytoene desaturase family protein n=1 Tax=Actinoalloteichus spitiensis TaxID=252394 RepID=UPI000360F9B5|nr:NAD(P)/FAD-dependent oxidoreductase [Actinoalloteichus spitiensis]
MPPAPEVSVVGSGPNGLAAAVTLARAGLTVEVHEAADTPGGGLRTTSLFDSHALHDVCSAVHPMAAASRFFREFDLTARGVRLRTPETSYAHPLDNAPTALAHRDLDRTCDRLGPDAARWRSLLSPLVRHSQDLCDLFLSDQRHLPATPRAALPLPSRILTHGTGLGRHAFHGPAAPALLTGVAAHTGGRLPSLTGAAVALLLGHLAHTTGWPLVEGGSARITDALLADLQAHNGTLHTGSRVTDLRQLARSRAVLLDLAPAGVLGIAGPLLPAGYRRALERFRYGTAAAKVDFLVSDPIPWTDPDTHGAGTVHLGGGDHEIRSTETATARGHRVARPFTLLSEPMSTDPTRGRPDRRPVWAYCHVPHGDTSDPVDRVRRQIERFAPGFSDTVIAARGVPAAALAAYNPNYVGGDIAAGAMTPWQAIARPAPRWDPYRTPLSGVYLCSSATPPGPGVHGMCGYHAASRVLRHEFGIVEPPALGPS